MFNDKHLKQPQHLVYLHGLNSNEHAQKGQLLDDYCQKHHSHITVHRPNLNLSPDKAIQKLQTLINQYPHIGMVGSSLGGFYANLLVNLTGKKAVLLNPSIDSGNSLKRFFADDFDSLPNDYVGHTTPDGWQITKSDIHWLMANRPTTSSYPQNLLVIVKKGDELLNYQETVDYFSQQGVDKHQLIIEEGGDHRMSDFDTKLAQVVQFLFG